MAPRVTVSADWSLFEFSQQTHDMKMIDDDITWQIITYSKISNACAVFCFNIVYYMNVYKIPAAVGCAWQDWNYNLWVKYIFQYFGNRKFSGKFPEILRKNFREIFFRKSYITTTVYCVRQVNTIIFALCQWYYNHYVPRWSLGNYSIAIIFEPIDLCRPMSQNVV